MYPNPWIRKHSTIRQVIDKLLSLNTTTGKTKKLDAVVHKKKHGAAGHRTMTTTTTVHAAVTQADRARRR